MVRRAARPVDVRAARFIEPNHVDDGKVAAALMERAGDLLAEPPKIEKIDVLAAKLPH